MDFSTLLTFQPYSLPRLEKTKFYQDLLTQLTQLHRENCPAYGRLLKALGYTENEIFSSQSVPMLPVSIFKDMDLKSIPDEAVFKTLTSSGTTGARVAKIYLDSQTAADQQRVLCQIVSDVIGEKRLPLLVLDSKKVLRDRAMFSARGAGIMGFSIFSSQTCFALDEHMQLDLKAVEDFLKKHSGGPVLLFGFTYMVWKHVILPLEGRGKQLDIPQGILIHGGGWKKLASEAVSAAEFKNRVRQATGVARVSDYYGMAEQTGCIYMECPHGHLHASIWSDILFRRAEDYSICALGEPGIIQVLSLLPRSYPGHSLLTEDIGVLLGEDDCPCGRLGKYFAVTGRIPRGEIRGCSDTYEG